MKKLGVLGMAVICALFFVACSASVTTANLEDMLLSSEIDESTYEPIEATNEFYTDTPEIYLTGTVDNAPEGTLVGAEWLYIQDGEEVFIDGADWETEDVKSSLLFSLSKPTEDWPIGDYKVNLYIDKEVVLTLSFKVVESEEEVIVEPTIAKVTDLQVVSEMDEEQIEPITITNTFSTDSPIVYVIGEIDYFTPGEMLRSEWYYVEEDNDTFIGESELELEYGWTVFYFSWFKPTEGWPVGEYWIDIYVDDIYMDSVSFVVE